MQMKNRSEKAKELFSEGYNCSQCVFVTFAEDYGIERKTALMLSTSLGGGFAGTRNICGAVLAIGMVAGLYTGTSTPGDKVGKARNYAYVNSLAEKFENEYGSIVCKYLKGIEKSDIPVKIRSCKEYIGYCAALLEENKPE